jgi:UDP-N-acetylglucosamine 2-epimerase (hydrolysing)
LKTKKIIFLTGTRADFGKLRPLIDKVEEAKNFECHVFVTGMHTLERYDFTYKEVKKRGYKNIFVFMNDSHIPQQDIVLSNTVVGLSDFVSKISPDMIVVHGDRIEALAGAIVGAFNNILVCHIEGGELTGSIDEMIRHSITKLSHIHMVSNTKAKKRLIQMGESKNSVFVIGSPDIDVMIGKNLPTKKQLCQTYEIPFTDYSILIFHPVTTTIKTLKHDIGELLLSVKNSQKNYVIIYPNNDPGSEIILNAYKNLKNNKNIKIFSSLRFDYFLTLLKNCDFIIGNSSSGITEAEIYGIPAIDIGSRQKNRSNNKNIIHVESDQKKILSAIKKISGKKFKLLRGFGYGKSAAYFLKILNNTPTWNIQIQKKFIDINPV